MRDIQKLDYLKYWITSIWDNSVYSSIWDNSSELDGIFVEQTINCNISHIFIILKLSNELWLSTNNQIGIIYSVGNHLVYVWLYQVRTVFVMFLKILASYAEQTIYRQFIFGHNVDDHIKAS